MKRFFSCIIAFVFAVAMTSYSAVVGKTKGARMHYVAETSQSEEMKKKIREAMGNERNEKVPEKKKR